LDEGGSSVEDQPRHRHDGGQGKGEDDEDLAAFAALVRSDSAHGDVPHGT
jgi:hypothetical protein